MGSTRWRLSWLRVVVLSVVILAPLAIPALVFLSSPAFADPDPEWYSANWSYRKKIIINSNNVTATLSDFPVLVSLSSDSDLAADALNNGNDILFTTDNGTTKLAHEIESFNGSSGGLTAWVKVPTLSSSADTTLYMYYGDATAGNQSDTQDVWNSGYEAVYHLHDDFNDSTSNARDGTNSGSLDVAGRIADGQEINPDDGADHIDLGTWSVSGQAFTMQTWVYFDDFSEDDPRIISKAQGTAVEDHVFMLSLIGTGEDETRMRFKTGTSDAAGTETLLSNTPLNATTWYLLAGTYDGVNMRILHNGTDIVNVGKTGDIRVNAWSIYAGSNPVSARPIDGRLDEVRISSAVRSADWLTTEYNNQNSPSDFVTVGVEQTQLQHDNWKSYNDAAHETQDDTFSGDQNTAYMHGTNFTTGTEYKIAFYDAEGSLSADAHKLQTDSVYADGDDGSLSASCAFTSYKATADPGTWHAVTCAVAQTPPDTYNEAWEYELTDDSFTVEGSAIPEFPTVFTAIGVTGLCFGIYYWMRNRRIRAVGRIQ